MVVLRVTLKGRHNIGSQETNNIFFYRSDEGLASSFTTVDLIALGWDFFNVVRSTTIESILSVQYRFTGVNVDIVDSNGNLQQSGEYVGDTPIQGASADDPMPTHDAYAIRFNRPGRPFRNAYKRICGGVETRSAGGLLDGVALTALQSFGNALFLNTIDATNAPAPLTGLQNVSFEYVIQKAFNNNIPLAVPLYARPSGVTVQPYVSTQNSRKTR